MVGITWCKYPLDLSELPEIAALARRLEEQPILAEARFLRVWRHFGRFFPEGEMPQTEMNVAALASACAWTREPSVLVEHLTAVGLLKRIGGAKRPRLSPFGWQEYQAGIVAKAVADRARSKRTRSKSQEMSRATVARPSLDPLATVERRGEENRRDQRRGDRARARPSVVPPPETDPNAMKEGTYDL